MNYTGTIYRPPFEARSLLLQVTTGCSHNRCSFCTMYRDVPFQAEPISQIEEDLQEGRFIESTFGEYLEEEEELLRLLKLTDCCYFGLHPSNVVPMHGNLPEDRDEMLREIERKRKQLRSRLSDRPVRGSEGAIVYERFRKPRAGH